MELDYKWARVKFLHIFAVFENFTGTLRFLQITWEKSCDY